jgi:peptidoglycan/LPS O-acetylase OafA/YrhL
MAHLIDPSWSAAPSPLRGAIDSVAGEGLHYMMGFFVLSGFCIQVSASRLASGGRFPLKTYAIARLTRILPLYYAALAFAVAVEFLASSHRPPLWRKGIEPGVLVDQVFLLQGFGQRYGSFAPSWSITNEFVYYLMFGLLAAATAAARSAARPSVAGLFATIGLAAGCIGLKRLGLDAEAATRASMVFGLGSIWFLGAIVADRADLLPRLKAARLASACWPLVLAAAMVLWHGQWTSQRVVYLTSGVAFTLLLVRFLIHEHDAPAPRRPPRELVQALGLASYPTYLLHGPVLQGVGAAFHAAGARPSWRLYWPLATALSIGLGWGVGLWVERPFLAWRAGLLARLKTTPKRTTESGAIAAPAPGAAR